MGINYRINYQRIQISDTMVQCEVILEEFMS